MSQLGSEMQRSLAMRCSRANRSLAFFQEGFDQLNPSYKRGRQDVRWLCATSQKNSDRKIVAHCQLHCRSTLVVFTVGICLVLQEDTNGSRATMSSSHM